MNRPTIEELNVSVFEYEDKFYAMTVKQRPSQSATHKVFMFNHPSPQFDHPPASLQCQDKDKDDHQDDCIQCAEDKEWRRYNREEIRIMKEVFSSFFSFNGKVGFSRTAGCSCPCSPGLVIKETFGDTRFSRYHDTYVQMEVLS